MDKIKNDLGWGSGALSEAVDWIGSHGGNIDWAVNTGVLGSEWVARPESIKFMSIAGLTELGGFGFQVSIGLRTSGSTSLPELEILISSERNEMCKLIAESKDEARLEAEVRLLAIRKLADTPKNNEKERLCLERIEKLREQVRILRMIR